MPAPGVASQSVLPHLALAVFPGLHHSATHGHGLVPVQLCLCLAAYSKKYVIIYTHLYAKYAYIYTYVYIHSMCLVACNICIYMYIYMYIYICIYMYVYPFIRYMLIAHISTYRHDILSFFFIYSLYRCLWLSRWVRLENDNGSCHRKLWETPQSPLGLNLFCPKIDTVKFGVRIPNISASIYDHQSPGHWTACAGKSPLLLDNSSN